MFNIYFSIQINLGKENNKTKLFYNYCNIYKGVIIKIDNNIKCNIGYINIDIKDIKIKLLQEQIQNYKIKKYKKALLKELEIKKHKKEKLKKDIKLKNHNNFE